jgi:hypothetical protein
MFVSRLKHIVPAKAGIHAEREARRRNFSMDPRLRRDDVDDVSDFSIPVLPTGSWPVSGSPRTENFARAMLLDRGNCDMSIVVVTMQQKT